jgi:hypothetical protein
MTVLQLHNTASRRLITVVTGQAFGISNAQSRTEAGFQYILQSTLLILIQQSAPYSSILSSMPYSLDTDGVVKQPTSDFHSTVTAQGVAW